MYDRMIDLHQVYYWDGFQWGVAYFLPLSQVLVCPRIDMSYGIQGPWQS